MGMAVDRRAARLGVLGLVGMLLFSLLGARLWFLQTVRADDLQDSVTVSKTRTVQVPPERGRIFDIDGRILADNERVLTVAVDWQMLRRKTQRTEIFTRVSGWLDVPVEEMEARFQRGIDSPFLPFPLKRDVDEETAAAILERSEDFPGVEILNEWDRVYPYAPHAAHVVGYMGAIQAEQAEEYQAQGYLLSERVGQFGVERELEEVLHGQWGEITYEVDAANRPIRVVEEIPPINGFDVQLTLDLDVQKYVEGTLETTLELRRTQLARNPTVRKPDGSLGPLAPSFPSAVYYKAPAGSALVMNYDTGGVVALASYPTFDNRWFEAGLSSEKFQEIFPSVDEFGNPIDPDRSILVNRAVQGRYNLGSTFKLFTAHAGLATDLIGPFEPYTDRGTYRLDDRSVGDPQRCDLGLIRCVFRNAYCGPRPCVYGTVDVEDAMAVSSDTFFYRIGEDIMLENNNDPVLQEQIRQWGFGADTGIELPFEFDGTVPDAELKREYAERGVISEGEGRNYFVADNVQLAIGQGLLSATPLQLATGYGAMVNRGFVIQPTVVQAIWEPGVPDGEVGFVDFSMGTMYEDRSAPDLIRQVPLTAEERDPLIRGLRRVITGPGVFVNGNRFDYKKTTGENLYANYPNEAIPLIGKTGTAQGAGNYPWNDSSAFVAAAVDSATLGPSETDPYVAVAYLEKAGFGSQAAAPVVKCVFMALSDETMMRPVEISDPLDLDDTVAAPSMSMPDRSCLSGIKSSGPIGRETVIE